MNGLLYVFLGLGILYGNYTKAQTPHTIHIITERGVFPVTPVKFNFHLNGHAFKIEDGICLDVQLNADSLYIVMKDKQVFKKKPVNLNISVKEDIYVLLYYRADGPRKSGRYGAEVICLECYEKIKAKHKRKEVLVRVI